MENAVDGGCISIYISPKPDLLGLWKSILLRFEERDQGVGNRDKKRESEAKP